jgi:hypothetical protein
LEWYFSVLFLFFHVSYLITSSCVLFP